MADLARQAPDLEPDLEPIVGRYLRLTLQNRSHRLYFEEAGRGIPLVCLHTAGSDGRQFRHLMTDREASAHLTLMAGALEPGGIFILGLDLSIYGQDQPDEEVYECRQGGRRAKHILMSIPAEPETRRELIINFVTTLKDKKETVLESSYDLRSYSAAELAELIGKSPLKIEAVYGYDGRDAVLDGPERALWLVLKRRDSRLFPETVS